MTAAARAYCFDCEVEVPGDRPLCDSCERHRADGHGPALLALDDEPGVACHGAGPDGDDFTLLGRAPRPVAADARHGWPSE